MRVCFRYNGVLRECGNLKKILKKICKKPVRMVCAFKDKDLKIHILISKFKYLSEISQAMKSTG
jgi:hypothetical protein